MFTKAIVRIPCKNMISGLTTSDLGKPDYQKALKQHEEYINVLRNCGLDVTILDPDEQFPDSTFVEDTALLTKKCAVITNPGAPSRKGEVIEMSNILKKFYQDIHKIENPGTLEAGDVMMAGDHFYIGLSERTNEDGANQLVKILSSNGYTASMVPLEKILHLKSGVSYLENDNMLATDAFINNPLFRKYNLIKVEDSESYAANSLWINGKVLVPKGFPKTKSKVINAGYNTIEVDVSEFRKLDGGLSCLSLRF